VRDSLTAAGYDAVVPSLLGFEQRGRPYWPACVESVVGACRDRAHEYVLVGHSGAGPMLPAMADALGRHVNAVIFAEAALAPLAGCSPLVPRWLVDHLAALAEGGVLPKWSEWWGDGAMDAVLEDSDRRAIVEDELPRLPLDYFTEEVPVPDGWADRVACSYLWYSPVYEADAAEASRRGWPVMRLEGGHLHMAVAPERVARALLALAGSA
jgi:hypothetical protein